MTSVRSRAMCLVSLFALIAGLVAAPTVRQAPPRSARRGGQEDPDPAAGLNDFHGQLRPPDSTSSGGASGATPPAGGAEYLASTCATSTPPTRNTLFVSAGDLIGATPLVSAIFHDEPTIEAMNLMGLDYNGVGNHEFDEGLDELLRMQDGGCHPVDGCSAATASTARTSTSWPPTSPTRTRARRSSRPTPSTGSRASTSPSSA